LPAGSPGSLRHSTPGYFPINKKTEDDLIAYEDDYFALAILIVDIIAGKELWHGKDTAAITEMLSDEQKIIESFVHQHLQRSTFRLPMLEKFVIGGLRCDSGFLVGLISLLENSFEVLRHVMTSNAIKK
jgi:hypothetical protein